jgi:hypothetical protein
MNGGRDPILLDRNQAAFILNSTVRGGFLRTRPAWVNRPITYPSDEIQLVVEKGLFQGATFYRPDTGNQAIIAQISGRLFRIDVVNNGMTLSEITIPNDPNPATATQAWLWQSDKYVIVNDGVSLPVFYDGTTSRRSRGPSVVLPETIATGIASPVTIGGIGTVALSGPYTGIFDVPVLINGEYWQPVASDDGYLVALKTIYDPAAAGQPQGSEVVIQPAIPGYITTFEQITTTRTIVAANFWSLQTVITAEFNYPVGTLISITGEDSDSNGNLFINGKTIVWRVTAISANKKTLTLRNNYQVYSGSSARVGFRYQIGTVVTVVSSTPANTSLGLLSEPLLPVAPGSEDQVYLTQKYTGVDGQIVFINGAQYYIRAIPETNQQTNPNDLWLINLSEATGLIANGSVINTVPELPPGRMGAYGQGQTWMSLVDGNSFVVSDISRGPSGTVAEDRRDSVLKTVDITFGGGKFSIPYTGSIITSITFVPKLDASLGQGPVQIGTNIGIFSANAPVDFGITSGIGDSVLPTPILPATFIGPGPSGQNSTILVNGDTFFRTVDGISSLILARREFNTWGNSPVSEEVEDRILSLDDKSLLPYGTADFFNNRVEYAVSPQASPGGVLHAGAVVMNTDTVSSLSDKSPPVYDGLWTGVNILQFVKGIFDGVQREFAFTYNVSTAKIELWELLQDGVAQFDNFAFPITWGFESASLFKESKPMNVKARLDTGELAIDQVVGTLGIRIWWRSDQGCWNLWKSFSICADRAGTPGYWPRITLGEPPSDNCTETSPQREGYTFQVKILFTGYARLLRANFKASEVATPEFEPITCDT